MNPFTNINFLKRMISLLKAYIACPDPTARGKLYITAVSCLGTDASSNDIAPDEFGCAETVNAIHKKAFGFEIGGDISTYRMYPILCKSRFFIKVDNPLEGDIIISPTGYKLRYSPMRNGHVGIVGREGVVMSNESSSGLFMENYTLYTWKVRFMDTGGYPIYYFRRI